MGLIMKKSLVLLPLLLLQGCDGSTIDSVKNYVYDFDTSMSVGNALDHRKICSDTKWKSFKDERGRTIVEYRCDLKGVSEYSQKTKNLALDSLKQSIKQHQDNLVHIKDNIEGALNALNLTSEIKSYMDIGGRRNLYLYCLQQIRIRLGSRGVMLLDNTGAINPEIIRYSSNDTKSQLSEIRDFMISKKINTPLEEKYAFLLVTGDSSNINYYINWYSNNKNNGVDKENQEILSLKFKIKSLKDEQNAKSVKQIFQWSIIKGKEPTLVASSFDIELTGGKHIPYHATPEASIYSIFRSSYDDTVSSYSQLTSSYNAPTWPFK
jgi:hypothetical protein